MKQTKNSAPKRVVLIGYPGQLAYDLLRVFELKQKSVAYDVCVVSHSQLEIASAEDVSRVINDWRADIVINTASYLDLKGCEDNPEKAFWSNAEGPNNLAISCKLRNALLIHLSTNYVFDGKKCDAPYTESDTVSPVSTYGVSKLAGEHSVRYWCPQHIIVRTSSLFGVQGPRYKKFHLVDLILNKLISGESCDLKTDEFFSPTYTFDLALAIREVLESGERGTFHLVNEGAVSVCELGWLIAEVSGLDAGLIKPVESGDGDGLRPRCGALTSERFLKLPKLKDALAEYFTDKKTFLGGINYGH